MSMGFQTKTAADLLEFSETQTGTRLIHTEDLAYNFNGTVSVSDFDDTKGFINLVVHAVWYDFNANPRVRLDPATTPIPARTRLIFNPIDMPNLHWDNSAKILTASPNSSPIYPTLVPDYTVGFFHIS